MEVALIGDAGVVEADDVEHIGPHLQQHDAEIAGAARPPRGERAVQRDLPEHRAPVFDEAGPLPRQHREAGRDIGRRRMHQDVARAARIGHA